MGRNQHKGNMQSNASQDVLIMGGKALVIMNLRYNPFGYMPNSASMLWPFGPSAGSGQAWAEEDSLIHLFKID